MREHSCANGERTMAGGNGDMGAHEATYGKVIGMLKWGGLACFLIALGVIWLISRS